MNISNVPGVTQESEVPQVEPCEAEETESRLEDNNNNVDDLEPVNETTPEDTRNNTILLTSMTKVIWVLHDVTSGIVLMVSPFNFLNWQWDKYLKTIEFFAKVQLISKNLANLPNISVKLKKAKYMDPKWLITA